MSPDGRAATLGPRYVLALYNGADLVGFAPWHGNTPVDASAGSAVDSFYSESCVRAQALRRAIEFAPLTVAPYDLQGRKPLDLIPVSEEIDVPLKDEETRMDMVRPAYADAKPAVDPATIDHSRRPDQRGGFMPAVLALAEAQRDLVRFVARLLPDAED